MNGIEKIIAHIESESNRECEAIRLEAAGECERIRAENEKLGQDEYRKLMDAGEKEVARRLERLNSLAMLESKKQVLALQQEMVAAAFERAAQKLLQLPEPQYIDFLARLSCSASLTGTEAIVLSSSDLAAYGDAVVNASNSMLSKKGRNAMLTVSDTPADIRGGLILKGDNIEVNCSVDALVAEYRNELAPTVASELFD